MKPTNARTRLFCTSLTLVTALAGCIDGDETDQGDEEALAEIESEVSFCPAAPSDTYGRALGSSSLKLTWSDNSADEMLFLIQRSDNGGSWANIATVPRDTESFIDGYSPSSSFRYRVSAMRYCASPPSPLAVVPKAPANLVGRYLGGSTFELTWSDRSNNESAFVIQKRVGTGAWADAKTVAANVTTTNIALSSGTNRFRVRAKTGSGASWYTNEVSH